MNKKNANNKLDLSQELHSNLMLVTTFIAIVGFVVLMMIYMAMKNPSFPTLATGLASFGGVGAWVVAAILAFRAVKYNKTYFLEYMIYCIVLGFGLTFMFNVPSFIFPFVYEKGINWAHSSLVVLMILTGIFFVVSVAWHGVLASSKRKK